MPYTIEIGKELGTLMHLKDDMMVEVDFEKDNDRLDYIEFEAFSLPDQEYALQNLRMISE